MTPITLTWIIYQANPLRYQSLWAISSMTFGTVAYAWIQWQFILSSRPKWLEKGIGMDYIYRFHGMMALLTIALAFIHGQLKEQVYGESFMTQMGSVALLIFTTISILSLGLMVTSKLHNVKWIAMMKRTLQEVKWFKYEQLKKYHNLTVIGQVMVVVHVLMTSQVRQSLLSFSAYMVLFLVAFGHYLYHKIYRTWLLMHNPLMVESLEKVELSQGENPRVMWHVHMRATMGKLFYQPGQFAFFRFLRNGKLEEHPFSITSSPTEELLTISVKQLGDFTKDMGGLEVGSQLLMDGPYGAFSYKLHKKEEGLVLIAAGIGITPAMAMIRHMRIMDEQRPVTLVWQIRSVEEAVFLEELEVYQQALKELKVELFINDLVGQSRHNQTVQIHSGKVKIEDLKDLLKGSLGKKKRVGYYICGPKAYMTFIIKNLRQAGIQKKYIHSENFSF